MPSTETADAARLSLRLQTVAGLVPPCARLIDIGTDHAWLPISLLMQNRCQSALAIDVRPGPLAIAKRNIRSAGLTDRIETRLGNGLDGLDLQPDDAVVIAGLGGYEMMDILGSQPRFCRAIVLQPMKSLPELRLWLGRQGYRIDEESLAAETHRVYAVIRCHYEGKSYEMPMLEAQAGPLLLHRQPEGYGRYLAGLLARLEKQSIGQPELVGIIDQIRIIHQQILEGCK